MNKKIFLLILLNIYTFLHSNLLALDIMIRLFSLDKLDEITIESLNSPLYTKCKKIKVKAKNSHIEIECNNSKIIKEKFEINPKNFFSIKAGDKKRTYAGKIKIENEKNKLKIINTIELEQYLLGVVKSEAKDLSQFQAYKAQAVVSRTYTLANKNRHKSSGYNLCDTTHCQLYTGFDGIKEEIRKAVYQTKGEILVYRGKPIWAFYHSICGGTTEDGSYLWQYEAKPYIKSIYDGKSDKPYCYNARGFKWRTKIGNKTFENFLKRKIVSKNETIKDLKITRLSPSGRVIEMEIVTDKRIKKISGINFYHIAGRDLGWDAIRSTKFRIYKKNNFIVFEGYGHGHGAGMCQHGADKMAELGYDYKAILNHYYKNVKMVKLN